MIGGERDGVKYCWIIQGWQWWEVLQEGGRKFGQMALRPFIRNEQIE
jgi:hypothetical protein